MHTPPNERSQRKQRNTPKNTAPFEARTSLGCWEKKCFFAVLMLDFRKEIFGFRTDLIITEKQRGKRLCGGVGALLKSRGARGLRPRGQGRLMERGPKCCRDNIWIPPPPPPLSSAAPWKYLYVRRKFYSKFGRSSLFEYQRRFVYLLLGSSYQTP